MTKNVDQSKRNFLKGAGLTVGGVVVGGVVGSLLGIGQKTKQPEQNHEHEEKPVDPGHAMMFFTNPEDFKVLEAACERIYPTDDLGPGAKDLCAAYFIDRQLAGNWGNNTKEYMQGPFLSGTPEQGYQTHLKRNEIFMLGIAGLKSEATSRYKDDNGKAKKFHALEAEEQDAILKDFESGTAELNGISSAMFFGMLISSTIEGVYSDPLYGGNKDMGGWKMRNYPGAQMSYYNEIELPGGMPKIEPKSLKDHMI